MSDRTGTVVRLDIETPFVRWGARPRGVDHTAASPISPSRRALPMRALERAIKFASIAGMSQVIVRNLDQQTVSALKSRAAAHGRSLEQELRLVLATAAKPSRQEVLEIADAIRSLGTKPVSSDLDALIREERDPSP